MAASSYLVGNRVYKGASNAPTRGTVDPMGYVERSLNNPSQKRSGLAAAALRRLQPGQQSNTSQNLDPQQANPLQGYSGAARSVQVRNPSTATGAGAAVQTPTPNPQAGPLAVTNTGKLKPQLPSASTGATGLPFDPTAADAQVQLQAQKNRFESDAAAEEQRIQREYMMQRRGVEEEMPNAQRELLERYAGRGLAYSSGYAYDQGDQQGQYARLLSQLESGQTDGLADLLRQRGLFNDDWSSRLQAVQAAAARRLAEQAGDLGLGGEQPDYGSVLDDLFGGGASSGGGEVSAPAPVESPVHSITNGFDPLGRRTVDNHPGLTGVAPTTSAPAVGDRMSQVGYTPLGGLPTTPQQVSAPAPVRDHSRDMSSFDSKSATQLSLGGTVRGGNGMLYKYDPISGRVVVVR